MTDLLSFDPGGTTGWARFYYDATTPLQLVDYGQISGGNTGFALWSKTFLAEDRVDEIVFEDFIDDGRTEFPDVTPLLIKGSIESLWTLEGIPTAIQRNVMKAHAPDEMLKEHGLWLRGEPHATDAVRHALALLKVRRHIPTMRKFWPRRGGLVALECGA